MTSLFQELELARTRVAELELKAEQERRELLARLPAHYGFSSFEDFAEAVREANGLSGGRPSAISAELVAGEADNPYWRDTPSEPEAAPTTFVAPGLHASRSAQASRPNDNESSSASPLPASPATEIASKPVAESASASTSATASPAPASPPAPAPRPLPTGTSLADPSNFGLMPDNSLLERGDKSEETFRMQLNTANTFAQQVLHTSRVPAAVWREWRDFARKAAEGLRGGVPVS